jgi:hypothetical protein
MLCMPPFVSQQLHPAREDIDRADQIGVVLEPTVHAREPGLFIAQLYSWSYFPSSCGGTPISIMRQYIEQQQIPHGNKTKRTTMLSTPSFPALNVRACRATGHHPQQR